MYKNIAIGVLAVALLAAVGLYVTKPATLSASVGTEHYNLENFYAGYTAGASGNTAVSSYNCATSSWNPAAVGSSTNATASVALTGFAQGDILSASLGTSTQSLSLKADPGTSTVVVTLFQPATSLAAVDIATTTVKVCNLH